jgi:hypothetical protein
LQVDAATVCQADQHLKAVLLALTERFQVNTAVAAAAAAGAVGPSTSAAAAAAVAAAAAGGDVSSSGHAAQRSALSESQVRLWLSIRGSSIQVRPRIWLNRQFKALFVILRP